MSNGFVQLHRSLFSHPAVVSCKDSYFRVLMAILINAAHSKCTHNDHGVLVDLEPGQYIYTERELAKQLGTNDTLVHRAVKLFLNVGILKQEVKHIKSIVTIAHEPTRALFLKIPKTKVKQEQKLKRSKSEAQNNKVINKQGKQTTSKTKEANASTAVVFPFLENLGLSDDEKRDLMTYRTEEGLKHAVEYSRVVPFTGSLVKQLMWAADKMPSIPEGIDLEKNKLIAKEFEETWSSKDCRIDICSNAVEIISKNGAICYVAIPYGIKGFRGNLEKNLLDRNFKQNKENFA